MKIFSTILALLIGVIFVVFGLNGFFHFIPMPPLSGDMGTFFGVISSTGFLSHIKLLEVIFGFMIVLNFKRPLAYILLAPIVVGIVLVEICIARQPGIGIPILFILAFLMYQERGRYLPIIK